MRYRYLHGTHLQVSELGFGTWTVSTGWWGDYTDEQARDLIRAGLHLGINYIDTADAYGNGPGATMLKALLPARPTRAAAGHVAEVHPLRLRAVAGAPRRRADRHLSAAQPARDDADAGRALGDAGAAARGGEDPLVRAVARPRDRLARRRDLRDRRPQGAGHTDDLQHARAGSRPRVHPRGGARRVVPGRARRDEERDEQEALHADAVLRPLVKKLSEPAKKL